MIAIYVFFCFFFVVNETFQNKNKNKTYLYRIGREVIVGILGILGKYSMTLERLEILKVVLFMIILDQ